MTKRQRWSWLASAVALAAGIALLTAAYGVSANKAGKASKRFGELRVVLDTIDYLDPQQSYTAQSFSVLWDVYQTLVTYKHVPGRAGTIPVPGLAQSMPRISRDGKTYRFVLRKGLRYSNGKPVLASDFKYAMKREFLAPGQGVGFYEDIVGAKQFEKTLKGDIPGIITNNAKRTITIKLTAPRGDFLAILALLFAAPVPAGTPPEDQSTHPIPSTAQYKISSYTPNVGFTMVQNPYFKPNKFIPRGNPKKITVKLIGDANAALQQVTSGKADYTNAAIEPDRIGDVQRRYGKQLHLRPTANTYYLWMNTRVAPFNKLNVRKAVNYAIDRKALVRLVWGGLGAPTQNVLPPTYPQYQKLNLYPHNLAKAKAMIKAAGVDGDQVTVWGRSVSDSVVATEYYASVLDSIGFKTKVNILPRTTYYTTIGNQDTKAQTGWARWLEDYPHPLDWFDVLLNGNRITAQNNNNYSNANNGAVNRLIERLKLKPVLTPAVNKQWAQVDKMVMQNALWAPWSNRIFPEFFGKSLGCYTVNNLYGVDYLRVCKK